MCFGHAEYIVHALDKLHLLLCTSLLAHYKLLHYSYMILIVLFIDKVDKQ